MEELINGYERKIKAVNELLEEQKDIIAIKRLETKRGCYRAFIVDLKRAMADVSTSENSLHKHIVMPRISHFKDENGVTCDLNAEGVNVHLQRDGTFEYYRSFGFAGRKELTPVYEA